MLCRELSFKAFDAFFVTPELCIDMARTPYKNASLPTMIAT